jgi:hypothetical protein
LRGQAAITSCSHATRRLKTTHRQRLRGKQRVSKESPFWEVPVWNRKNSPSPTTTSLIDCIDILHELEEGQRELGSQQNKKKRGEASDDHPTPPPARQTPSRPPHLLQATKTWISGSRDAFFCAKENRNGPFLDRAVFAADTAPRCISRVFAASRVPRVIRGGLSGGVDDAATGLGRPKNRSWATIHSQRAENRARGVAGSKCR